MDEITQVIGPKSWGICQLRLWADLNPIEFAIQLEVAKQSSEGASLLQLGPREWWMVSESPISVDIVSKTAETYACVVDITAAYLALTLKGGDTYRTLSRIGNAHDQNWLTRANARRLQLADCGVVVLPQAQNEFTMLVARSEAGHLLMAIQKTLEIDALR